MSEIVRIPQLRFPEFSNEWENEVVGNISNKVTDGTHDTPKPSSTGVPYITAIHVKDGVIDFDRCYYLPIEEHKKIYSRCNPEKNDILMVNIGAGTATTALINIDYEFSLKNVALIKPNKLKSSSKFLAQSLRYKSERLHHQLTSGGAQPFLSLKEIKRIKLNLPAKPEQTKIAAFLTAVDNKIEQLSKKQELLGEYKKGLMQKIFSQAIRFKSDDGSEFPDWKKKKLRDVLSSVSTRPYQIKSADILEFGSHKVVDQGQKELAGYTNEKDKLLTNDGVIVYGDHTTIVKFINYDFVVGADGVKLLTSDSNNMKYLYFNLLFNNVEPEGYKRHFSILKNVVLQIPSLPEQNKIANFLSSIDNKIEQVGKQLDESKQFKKALLQQMFV
jgi:type I restriction enzyme S subunit